MEQFRSGRHGRRLCRLAAVLVFVAASERHVRADCWSGRLRGIQPSVVSVSPSMVGGQQLHDGSIGRIGDEMRLDGTASTGGMCDNYCNEVFIGTVPRHFGLIEWTVTIDSPTEGVSSTYAVGTVYSLISNAQSVDTRDLSSTGPVMFWFWWPGTYTFHTHAQVVPANDCEAQQPDPIAPDFTVVVLDRPSDEGSPPCNASVGAPINVANGNVFVEQEDYARSTGHRVTRAYNSLTANQRVGIFGEGWSSEYEESITSYGTRLLRLDSGLGQSLWFLRPATGQPTDPFLPLAPANTQASIVSTGSGWNVAWVDGSIDSFNSSGKLTSIVERNGNATLLAYDGGGRLSTVTDSWGHVLTYHYSDLSTRASSISDSTGTIASYLYNDGLSEVDYPDGSKLTFTYDANHGLLTIRDGLGNLLESHTYDSNRRGLTSQRNSGAGLVTLNYVSSNETHVTDALGNIRVFHYELIANSHLVTGVVGSCDCGGLGESSTWNYDGVGNVISYTDGLQRTTTKSYDTRGNLQSVVDPLNNTYAYTYNDFGEPLTVTDPLRLVTVNTYDPTGNLLTSTTPAGDTTVYTYSARGLLTSVRDPLAHTTTFQYDTHGNMTQMTDPLGKVTVIGYDSRGRVTSAKDPLLRKTVITRDPRGRIRTITRPNGKVYTASYDGAGRLVSVTDPLNHATTIGWDGAYRLTGITDPLRGLSIFGYDATDTLASITDERHKTTTFARDGLGRVSTITRPGGTHESYTWDGAGRVATQVDRKGITTTFQWDAVGRLTRKDHSDGTPSLVVTYDADGRVTTASNGADTLTWTYDTRGRIATEASSANGSTVTYTWDYVDNLTALSLNGSSFLSYTFDADDRPATLVRGAQTYTFAYNDASERTSLVHPNGVTTTSTYNMLGQLANLKAKKGSKTVASASYTFDSVGNRRSKTLLEYSESYLFDAKDELTQAKRGNTITEHYTWDLAANRLSALGSPGWTYDNDNQLLTTPTATLSYDLNGNLTQKVEGGNTWLYSWNAEDRLMQVKKNGSVVVQFTYDPLGRRIAKTTGSATTRYIYAGRDAIQTQTGPAIVRYVHGPRVDEALAVEQGSSTSYYHADALGSVVKTTNSSRTVTGTQAYDAFGVPSGTLPSGPAYTGQPWDSETGLYFYRARYYDPKLGRFISEDPAGLTTGLNRYRYALNKPVNLKDPSGTDIAVIENGTTGWCFSCNPFGHTALAITDRGVWSFGNDTPLGSSLIDYLFRESHKRNTNVYIIPTTPEQDAAAAAALELLRSEPVGVIKGNCSSKSNRALDAAGVPIGSRPWLPGSAGRRASQFDGYHFIAIPRNTVPAIPDFLHQFEPQ